jgi:hypothetical protein
VFIDPFFVSGGHTSGLVVDAQGIFHPTWTDNRNGVAQIWSAPIGVEGTVVEHGAVDLSDLEDISKSVTLKIGEIEFDREGGTLSMVARLKNTSKNTIEGPIRVRVITLESALGVAEITNADNGEHGTGAVWDFSSHLAEGTLESLQLSTAKELTFQLTDVRRLLPGKDLDLGVLSLDTRVLGKIVKEEDEDDADEE